MLDLEGLFDFDLEGLLNFTLDGLLVFILDGLLLIDEGRVPLFSFFSLGIDIDFFKLDFLFNKLFLILGLFLRLKESDFTGVFGSNSINKIKILIYKMN